MNKHFTWINLRVHGKTERVEIRSHSDGSKHEFEAIWLNPGGADVRAKDTDIEKLKGHVLKLIENLNALKWRNILHVTVDSKITEGETTGMVSDHKFILPWECKVEIEVMTHQLATDRKGKKIQRKEPSEWPTPHWPEVGPRESESWSDKDMRAIIDDTPENREALTRIFQGFHLLRQRLCDLLSPAKIEETLSKVKAGQLLLQQETSDVAGNDPRPTEGTLHPR
jgi:hypothetical protein